MMLELPMPPSANVYWRVYGGKMKKSKAARAYQVLVRAMYPASILKPMCGWLTVRLDVWLCRGDLDNRVKVALDALNGLAWLDDKQVATIHAVRYRSSAATERVVVGVWEQVAPEEPMDESGILVPLRRVERVPATGKAVRL